MDCDVMNSIPSIGKRDRSTALYRMFDGEGRLLYIGISVAPNVRMAQHRHTGDWIYSVSRIELQWFETGADARAAEREAILAERPPHNIAYVQPGAFRSDKQKAGPVLADWLSSNGVSVDQFAARIGVTRAKLEKIIACDLRPRTDLAERIARQTDGHLPVCIWARGGRVERFYSPDAARARRLLDAIAQVAA